MSKYYAAAAKSLQSCPTLCDPMDCSLPGFSVHGILQARTLEWVAISFSNAGKWKVRVKSLSCVWLLATPRTAANQAPPSMGFSRQEHWSGVPLPSPLNTIYASNCQGCQVLLFRRLSSWENNHRRSHKWAHSASTTMVLCSLKVYLEHRRWSAEHEIY